MVRGAAVALALLVVAGGTAGCDDDDVAATGVERFCELSARLSEDAGQAVSGTEPDPADEDPFAPFAAAMQEHFRRDEVQERLDDLVEAAPAEVRDAVEQRNEAFRALARTGDLAKLQSPEAGEASQTVATFEAEHCTPEESAPGEGGDDAPGGAPADDAPADAPADDDHHGDTPADDGH